MSTTREALDREFRQLLLELMLVSSGTTASYNGAGGRGEKANPRPPGEKLPPHDYWARQYDLQETDDGRRAVIKSAREDLERLAGQYQRNTQGETPAQWRERLLTETEGWPPIDIERSAWRTSEKVVRRMRAEDGRWPETGYKIEADHQQPEQSLADRVREYDSAGFSERQIAMLVSAPKSKVRRLLGRAA